MSKDKGFTIIELIITIAIMVILITMTVGIFYNSSKKSKERLLETKKQTIEISAEKWANDVSLRETLTICVDRLIKEGYLDEENEDGEIINPVDNSTLNGYAVFIEIKNGNYYAKFQEGNNCDANPQKLKKLYDLILAQGEGKSAIESKGNPNFGVVPTTATSGLYATQDDYGTSYYYRGEKNALANNVIFAGFQWKVVRINGDKSIRLIYNGVCPNNSCTINITGVATAINNGTFYAWNATYRNDAKYVGYVYGGANGEASTSKVQAQANETDSNAKNVLDAWYESNIKNTKYEQYAVDNIFCNDRGIESGNGYGFSEPTRYKIYARLWANASNPTPTLMCEQKNDRFTVDDEDLGNGALTYPIGLITADEVQYGGIGKNVYNISQFLYTGQDYLTFSPHSFGSDSAFICVVYRGGQMLTIDVHSVNTSTLRAVLNLSSEVLVTTGDGTSSNPYIIFTE